MKTLECRGITLSDKQTKICVPITGTDLEEIKEQAEKIANMNPDVVEWRADFYDVKDNDETEFEQCLKAINDNLKKIPIIYTYRTSNEGGEKSIDVDDYCRLCKYVSEISEKYNVAMIDVELYENKDQKNIGKLLLDIKSTGVKVIGSNHHFEGTPSEKDIFNVLKTMEDIDEETCEANSKTLSDLYMNGFAWASTYAPIYLHSVDGEKVTSMTESADKKYIVINNNED